MCWISNNKPERLIAKECITVYKVVQIYPDGKILSYFNDFPYKLGGIYNTVITVKHLKDGYNDFYFVEEGFHSYNYHLKICTDHDGTELLFDYRPVWVNLMKLTKKEIEELQPSNPEGEAFVTLVPGSTKKIIGRNLTWEDGPIEINDNMLPKKEILAYFKCLKEDWNEYTLAINSKNRTLSEYIRDYAN